MIIPIRCKTCGKVLADKFEEFQRTVQEVDGAVDMDIDSADGKTRKGKKLDDLGITKMCCRAVMLTHVDMLKHI
jgi:DNA-directed RNA polymerase subunit N (RpoN/RPB10)